jgi:hypothetical protein
MAIEDKGSPRNEAALIERKLAATLTGARHDDGSHDHHHAHDEACGCGHDHEHHHDHHHGHDHHHHGERPAMTEETAGRLAGAERMTEPPRDVKGRR